MRRFISRIRSVIAQRRAFAVCTLSSHYLVKCLILSCNGFSGVAFVLYGTTSPEAGNYSVTVNNQTVFYSAKSSFLEHDTLLHYSTGLDPSANHTVTVTNEGGGTLSLLEGGFGVYSPDSQVSGVS
jgi:hypothetical protein